MYRKFIMISSKKMLSNPEGPCNGLDGRCLVLVVVIVYGFKGSKDQGLSAEG
jgi:hypothetical protein